MKSHNKTTFLNAIATVGMIGASSAAGIFSATTANITAIANAPSGGEMLPTITGATPNLLVTQAAQNNNMAGFASTSNIDTLIGGGGLTAADTVTMSVTVDSISGAQFRSNGYEFGLSESASFRPATGSFLLGMAASNSGSDVRFMSKFGSTDVNGDGSLDWNSNQDAILDGFTITLTADVVGYSFFIEGILVAGSTNADYTDGDTTATISGNWAGTEFLDNFGGGHLYTAVQQRTGQTEGDNMITDYSAATIDVTVVPEPSSAALLGLAGLVLILRRRK
ncbi:MAG: PEP-CTERM sorting domain-containing protein [Luteolibacter sp.]